jgi:ribulose-phosphate 3-epimerase
MTGRIRTSQTGQVAAPLPLPAGASLEQELAAVEAGGADRVHLDMPSELSNRAKSTRLSLIRSVRRLTRLPLEVHLSPTATQTFAGELSDSDLLVMDWTTKDEVSRALERLRLSGPAALAVDPATPEEELEALLPALDQVLVVAGPPGLADRTALFEALPKIRQIRETIERINGRCILEVEGGIDEVTARLAVLAGAAIVVPGQWIYTYTRGVAAALQSLRGSISRFA